MMIGEGKVVKLLNGKKLGVIGKDKVFRVYRKKKTHFMKVYKGWFMNKTLLEELRDIGIEIIEIHAYDEERIYRTLLDNFFRFGIKYINPKNEKDEQLGLELKYWNVYPMQKPKKKELANLKKFV